MNRSASQNLAVLVGTRKGGIVFRGTAGRREWKADPPQFRGKPVHHMIADPCSGRCFAAVSTEFWGAGLFVSDDAGREWRESKTPPRFPEGDERAMKKLWHIRPGRPTEPGVVYAGVEPAALFRSTDNGETWTEIKSLNDHPSRDKWFPGAGGLTLHSIVLHPSNPQRMWAAISAAGTFRTDDGGRTWNPKNKGVRADFLPDKFPEVGQCVHKLVQNPANPDVLYQQNHCGMYRSDDAGDNWTDLCEGLPSRFGFPMAVHPHKPKTVYVIPEESDETRVTPGGRLSVWRSDDGGGRWRELSQGLPQNGAYQNVLREAMATDTENPAGIYFGTATGQLCFSPDEGESWQTIANWLPPIYSVEV
ncbi:MAG: exo-alpha-sialidase, partial [candidate division Zixibacteria bacterium]|nr:exo-alpha-sialidase [candidate division Zixibacteria bacterium]